MKFFMRVFQPKKALEGENKKQSTAGQHDAMSITTSIDDMVSECSKVSGGKHGKKNGGHRKSKKQTPIPNIVEEHQTPNEKLVSAYIDKLNQNTTTAQDILSFFASEKVPFKFEDVPSLPSRIYADEVMRLYKSFPDFQIKYETIKETQSGRVVVEECRVSGTHTGAPYGFAHFPPVETSNRHCVNDPERMWVTIKDGKITMMEVISLGDISGCPGFYVQIGGALDMPPQDKPFA